MIWRADQRAGGPPSAPQAARGGHNTWQHECTGVCSERGEQQADARGRWAADLFERKCTSCTGHTVTQRRQHIRSEHIVGKGEGKVIRLTSRGAAAASTSIGHSRSYTTQWPPPTAKHPNLHSSAPRAMGRAVSHKLVAVRSPADATNSGRAAKPGRACRSHKRQREHVPKCARGGSRSRPRSRGMRSSRDRALQGITTPAPHQSAIRATGRTTERTKNRIKGKRNASAHAVLRDAAKHRRSA